MKRVLFIALFYLCTLTLSAQTFELTPEGFRNKENLEKSYLVIDVPEKTASEMYTATHNYIQKNYNSPMDVIKGDIKDQHIHFNTYAKNVFDLKIKSTRVIISVDYTTDLDFKDGKFKCEFLDLKMTRDYGGLPALIKGSKYSGVVVFDKKGKLVVPELKSQIEEYFNNRIELFKNTYSNKLKKSDDW